MGIKYNIKKTLFILLISITKNLVAQNSNTNGKNTSSGFFKDRVCECEYKNNTPFNGEVCNDYTIILYVSGNVLKKTSFQYANPSQLESVHYYKNGEISKETEYVDDKIYTLIYKDNRRYSGQSYNRLSGNIESFKNGIEHGTFYNNNYYSKLAISGNKVNGKRHGKIIFKNVNTGKTSSCIYKQGSPINGTIINKHTNRVSSYKKGLKHGLETTFRANNNYRNSPFDSITRNYKNGKLEGEAQYYKASKFLAKGRYKNDEAYTGIFFDEPEEGNYNIYTFKNGKILTKEEITHDFKNKFTYKNQKISQGEYYYKNELIAKGKFKNKLPYNGVFAKIEAVNKHYYPERYTLSNYKNGQKNGNEKLIHFKDKRLEQITNYQKGNPIRKVLFTPFKTNDSLIGIYKDGKPFSGIFFNDLLDKKTQEKSSISLINHYKNGEKSGFQYYTVTGSHLEKVLDSIKYIKGHPFKGSVLSEYQGVTSQDIYENGIKLKSNLYSFGIESSLNYIVNYTSDGFNTTKRSSKNRYIKHNKVSYTNLSKNEGRVIIYSKDLEIGSFTFTEKGIKTVNISFKENSATVNIQSNALNKGTITIETKEQLIQLDYQRSKKLEINPIGLKIWEPLFFKTDGILYYYLKDKKTLVSTCTSKNGKEHDGIITRVNKDGTYDYRQYQNGKRIKTKKNITEKQLLEDVKRLKN